MIRTHFPQSQFIVVSLKEGMFNNANVIFRTKVRHTHAHLPPFADPSALSVVVRGRRLHRPAHHPGAERRATRRKPGAGGGGCQASARGWGLQRELPRLSSCCAPIHSPDATSTDEPRRGRLNLAVLPLGWLAQRAEKGEAHIESLAHRRLSRGQRLAQSRKLPPGSGARWASLLLSLPSAPAR